MKFIKWFFKTLGILVVGSIVVILLFNLLGDVFIKTSIGHSDKVYVVIDEKEIPTSKSDGEMLKQLLLSDNMKVPDGLSCGFGMDYSIKFTNTKASFFTVYVCPACDKCPIFQIGSGYYEYSDKARADFEKTVEKYGMKFPNI